MKNFKFAFAVLCLSAVYASAHAQTVDGAEASASFFGIFSGYGVVVTGYYADYYNLVPTFAIGSGYNNSYALGVYGAESAALNESVAGPGAGYATSGYGIEQVFTLTNENPFGATEYFEVYDILKQEQIVTAGGYSTTYGGIRISQGYSTLLEYNQVTLNGDGIASDLAVNWSVDSYNYSPGYSYTTSHGSYVGYLAFGQSVTIGVWASGITRATASGVPGPAAVAPFAIGLVAALRRRNKKS